MNKSLFKEFNPISEKEWKQKIQVDLKGKDYNETMVTHTDEGIDIKPFYHQESNIAIDIPSPSKWFITEEVFLDQLDDFKKIKSKGGEVFFFNLKDVKNLPEELADSDSDLIFLMDDLKLSELKIKDNIIYLYDPINHFICDGTWKINQKEDLSQLQSFVNKTNSITIDGRIFHNSGANITQQLAYISSQLQYYLTNLNIENQSIDIHILSAVGTNFFFEIAKLKALRLLVNSICKNLNINYKLKLITEPGLHHMSIYDYNVNMLRSTSECMSAILGGSNFVKNTNYDVIFKNHNDFSQRVSRNQLLILKHESYFDKVENIADGSYYINYLIKALAEKSLEIFKSIEKSGGILQQLFDGKIQDKINQQYLDTLEKFKSKTFKLVGVNVFENTEDKMSKQLDFDIFNKKEKRKTLIKPLLTRRIAESLEREKLAEEAKNVSNEK